MGLREELVRKMDRKRQEIVELQTQIRLAEEYVKALEDAFKMLPREGANDGLAGQILRPNTMVAKAREAILTAGRPMHVNELLKAIGRQAGRAEKAALSGSLAAYVRKGEIFTRSAPNTYGLKELPVVAGPTTEPVPPAGFGKL